MGTVVHRMTVAALVAAVAVGGCAGVRTTSGSTATGPTSRSAPAPTVHTPSVPSTHGPDLAVGHSAWVSVSVATVWRSPDSPRPVDAPALAHPAGIETCLGDMTLAERRGLDGRADT
ncbi:MAG: hypothetical protein WB797_19225, partial [Nocardioides sp.]